MLYQVTQYLGIKSFKRKYPNMTRRAVDIQERDYLKESGQVTEGQCDLGLTAVAAQDILDIMYADFQVGFAWINRRNSAATHEFNP